MPVYGSGTSEKSKSSQSMTVLSPMKMAGTKRKASEVRTDKRVVHWTPNMDRYLIKRFGKAQKLSGDQPIPWKSIEAKVSEHCEVYITGGIRCRNRFNKLKKHYSAILQVSNLSGFGVDEDLDLKIFVGSNQRLPVWPRKNSITCTRWLMPSEIRFSLVSFSLAPIFRNFNSNSWLFSQAII